MKYAYIKSGHAVNELQIRGDHPNTIPDGPLKYTIQFLNVFGQSPCLIVSFGSQTKRTSLGKCQAFSYPGRNTVDTLFKKLCLQVKIFIVVFYRLHRFKPDFILCASPRTAVWGSFLYAIWHRVPIVHSRHNSLAPGKGLLKKILSMLDSYVMRQMDFIVCHGEFIYKQLQEIGIAPDRVCQFYPGFQNLFKLAETFLKENAVNGHTSNGKSICYIGRIETDKGVLDLMEACIPIIKEDPDVILTFVGNGSALKALKKQILLNNLASQIKCLGRIPHQDIAAVLKECRFAVTPTQSICPEGFCKAAVEPMIFGKPTIAPLFGPFPGFIKNGYNGLLYQTDSVESLRQSIRRLLNNDLLYKKLCFGALKTGISFVNPSITFEKALVRAAHRIKISQKDENSS